MRNRIALGTALVIVVITAVSFFSSLFITDRNMKDALAKDLSLAIDVAEGLVSKEILLLKSSAATIAERLLLARSADEMADMAHTQLRLYDDFIALTVFGQDGKVLANYGDPVSLDSAADEMQSLDNALHGKRGISSTLRDRDTGDLVMRIYAPMGADRVLAATMPGLAFTGLILDYTFWKTGKIYIFDNEGTIIADADTKAVLNRYNPMRETNAGATDKNTVSFGRFLERALSSYKNLDSYFNHGTEHLCYLDVLRSYLHNTRPLLDSIAIVSEDMLADYAITIHGIKGASRGIFADLVADLAEALEKAAVSGDFAFVSKNNALFLKAARKLLADMEQMLASRNDKRPKPAKDKPDKEMLRKLSAACVAYDMDGLDGAMAKLDAFEYASGGELIAWLKDNVSKGHFDQIRERLESLPEKEMA